MNKVILLGRLTKDPEVSFSQSSEPVTITKYALAVNRRVKRENEPEADFINCISFGRQAEFAEKYFTKGMQIAVSGRLQIRSYEKNGERRYFTEVVIEEQDFAEAKKDSSDKSSAAESSSSTPGFNPFVRTNTNKGSKQSYQQLEEDNNQFFDIPA